MSLLLLMMMMMTMMMIPSFKSNLTRLRTRSIGLFVDNHVMSKDPRGLLVSLTGLASSGELSGELNIRRRSR